MSAAHAQAYPQLKSRADWDTWYFALLAATPRALWPSIDPLRLTKNPLLPQPIKPLLAHFGTTPSGPHDLTDRQRADFLCALRVYELDYNEWADQERGLQKVLDFVVRTVPQMYWAKWDLIGDVPATLTVIANAFLPSRAEACAKLVRTWTELVNPGTDGPFAWASLWKITYNSMVDQDMPEVKTPLAHQYFLQSVQAFCPTFGVSHAELAFHPDQTVWSKLADFETVVDEYIYFIGTTTSRSRSVDPIPMGVDGPPSCSDEVVDPAPARPRTAVPDASLNPKSQPFVPATNLNAAAPPFMPAQPPAEAQSGKPGGKGGHAVKITVPPKHPAAADAPERTFETGRSSESRSGRGRSKGKERAPAVNPAATSFVPGGWVDAPAPTLDSGAVPGGLAGAGAGFGNDKSAASSQAFTGSDLLGLGSGSFTSPEIGSRGRNRRKGDDDRSAGESRSGRDGVSAASESKSDRDGDFRLPVLEETGKETDGPDYLIESFRPPSRPPHSPRGGHRAQEGPGCGGHEAEAEAEPGAEAGGLNEDDDEGSGYAHSDNEDEPNQDEAGDDAHSDYEDEEDRNSGDDNQDENASFTPTFEHIQVTSGGRIIPIVQDPYQEEFLTGGGGFVPDTGEDDYNPQSNPHSEPARSSAAPSTRATSPRGRSSAATGPSSGPSFTCATSASPAQSPGSNSNSNSNSNSKLGSKSCSDTSSRWDEPAARTAVKLSRSAAFRNAGGRPSPSYGYTNLAHPNSPPAGGSCPSPGPRAPGITGAVSGGGSPSAPGTPASTDDVGTLPSCPCGIRHRFQECFYLNAHLRPPHREFVLDPAVLAKVGRAVRANGVLARQIESALRQWQLKRARENRPIGPVNGLPVVDVRSRGSGLRVGRSGRAGGGGGGGGPAGSGDPWDRFGTGGDGSAGVGSSSGSGVGVGTAGLDSYGELPPLPPLPPVRSPSRPRFVTMAGASPADGFVKASGEPVLAFW